MNREEQGRARAGMITGSCARTIMRGSQEAWATLSKRLWADDGSEFAREVRGARRYGQEKERKGVSLFWEKHPELHIETDVGFIAMTDQPQFDVPAEIEHVVRLLGVSPDGLVYAPAHHGAQYGQRVAGLECKSPVEREVWEKYAWEMRFGACPDEHVDQCQHGMLVLRLKEWWFVTHHETAYVEVLVRQDHAWVERYLERLIPFVDFYLNDRPPVRDKLAAGRIGDL